MAQKQIAPAQNRTSTRVHSLEANGGGWLSGMEMDSYKSQILDGVLVQKQNRTSWCLKLLASVSQFFGTKCTHSHVPGLKGETLFGEILKFFWCIC